MKELFKSKKVLVLVALLIGVFGFVLITNNKKIEEKILYRDGIKLLDYNQVQDGDEDILNSDKITFDAFFLSDENNDGEAEKYRGKSIDISNSGKLWIELKNKGGETLKNAYIEFVNNNVRIEGALAKDTEIAETVISNNITRIPLNEISVGTTKMFYLNVTPNISNNIKSYNGTNKVLLKGTVVKDNNEIDIEKEVEYLVNLYGTNSSLNGYIEDVSVSAPMVEYGSDDTVEVTYNVRLKELKDLMLLKSTNIEATISKLNGFDPLSVRIEGNDFEFEYDETTNKLTARREAEVENDRIVKQAYSYKEFVRGSYNNTQYTSVDSATGWSKTADGTYSDPNSINRSTYYKVNALTIKVVYPNAASYKTGTSTVSLKSWYEAFNNDELTDSVLTGGNYNYNLISNYQCDDSDGFVSSIYSNVRINKYTTVNNNQSYVDSTNIKNAYVSETTNNVKYDIDIAPYIGGYNPQYKIGGLKIYDLGNNYINQTLNMKEFEKYYSMALSGNIMSIIGQNGNVKVIDADTNEVLHIFDKDNYNEVYFFDKDVRSVRIEVSDIDDDAALINGIGEWNELFDIKLTKEIDTTYIKNNFTYDQFAEWNHIYTTFRTDWTAGGFTSENDTANIADSLGRRVQRVSAIFSSGQSRVKFDVKTTDTNNELEFNIDTQEITRLYKGYKNGEFLIELPDAVLYYEVVEDDLDYEMLEDEWHKYLKIKVSNDNSQRYNITFHLNIVPDVKVVNQTVYFKIYAYNPECHDYESAVADKHDINNNGDTTEKVGYNSTSMNLIAPTTVITAASLKNYNAKNEVSVSPMIAEIDPVVSNGRAKVSIDVINNSGFAIQDTKVIGKLAFVGNTSQVDNSDLNSEFDVHMTSAGITVPNKVKNHTTVYYSESANPSDDLNDSNNGWTEEPSDFSLVKSYMIVIDDYEIANQAGLTFDYNITMPAETSNLYKKTYFTHAVYYKLDTEDGLVSSNVGSSKLGITMTRKYDLNINTLRKGKNKKVDLITYELEDPDGRIRTITPRDNYVEVKGLYIGKEYKLRQKSISNNYEIDTEEKTFTIVNGNNDALEIVTNGVYKSATIDENVLNVTIENRPRYTVVVKVSDLDTSANISGAKFNLRGKGYENGYTLMSNVNGEITFKNLYLDTVYYLYQVSSPNYQKAGSISFMIGYDANGDIKFRTYNTPNISGVTMTSDSGSDFTLNSSYAQQIYIQSPSTSQATRSKGYVTLDLTNYNNNYTLSFYSVSSKNYYNSMVTNQIGTVNVYVTDYLSSSINQLVSSNVPAAASYNQTNLYQGAAFNSDVTTAITSTGEIIPIKGGRKYYIYIDQYSTYSYIPLSSFRISTSGSEYLFSDEDTLTGSNGQMVQTLDNNINYQQPVTRVNVTNEIIPTTKFKIIKKDSDTGDLLPNAIYKLTGPNIIDSAYLTTDENGEASYNIYYYLMGDYSNAGYTSASDAYYLYTLKEISAPSGYAIDTKEYKFRLTDKITCPTEGECSKDNATHELNVYYDDTEYAFDETAYDSNNKSVNAYLYDSPLVKIKKTDKDTGELLPNTMFAINKATKANGREIISDALDINGNLVGDELEIDGVTYRVITTNDRGEITLNLERGQYRLKEVQASSDKYDLTNQVYYFGVGESVPYQAAGITFDKAYNLETNVVGYQYSLGYNGYKPTIDGGAIIKLNRNYIAKYDKDGVRQWDYQINSLDNTIDQCIGNVEVTFNYPDKDSVTYTGCVSFGSEIYEVFPTQSGDIFVSGTLELSINGVKVNLTSSLPYIRLNSDGTVSDKYKISVDFTGRKTNSEGYYGISDFNRTENPDEIYYGQIDNYQSTYGITKINGFPYYTGGTSQYGYFTDSNIRGFATTPTGEYYILAYTPVRLFKFDANGNFVGFKNVNDEIRTIYPQDIYIQSNYGDGAVTTNLDVDSDENLLFTSAFWHNEFSELRIKYDKDLNLIYAKPTFYNETDYPMVRNFLNTFQLPVIQMLPNSGYYFYALQYTGRGSKDSIDDFLGDVLTNNDYFEIPEQDMNAYNYYVLEYDKDGNAVNAVNIGRKNNDRLYPDSNMYVVKGLDYYTSNRALNVIPYDDGFVVISKYRSYAGSNKVTLVSGEKVTITGNFIMYKVNMDSKVEWIKQYNIYRDSYEYSDGILSHKDNDGSIRLFFSSKPVIKDLDGNQLTDTEANVYVFKPSSEVLAAGPEAYVLNIENEAKKFNINVKSDEGSIATITRKDGTEQTVTNGELVSEIVRYDENQTSEIKITLNPNYVLDSVTVNGKEFTYQVNNDGTITLDKIPNVKEDKTIEIKTLRDKRSVIVHHYLKNTTTRVASDEIFIGDASDTYTAMPIISNLYSLIKDNDGNYIMPNNYTGRFEDATGDVIFYYKENDVELNVHYYLENSEKELAPTLVERKQLGSSYSTEPVDIEFYRVSRVLGDERGILSQNRTEVTYFYQEVPSTITVKHLDINTLREVAPTETKTVGANEQYETSVSSEIPVNYRYVSSTNNTNDIARSENIEVIYYYDVIPFNVSVDKRIGNITINGESIDVVNSKSTSITAETTDEIIVYYDVLLKNNGELKATFKVVEKDVINFDIYDLDEFTASSEGYVLETELEPGESKAYRIGYKWNQKDYGISVNEVRLNEVRNDLGFAEPDESDNTSMTTVLIDNGIVLGVSDDNPHTSDRIDISINLFIISIIGLISTTYIYFKNNKQCVQN